LLRSSVLNGSFATISAAEVARALTGSSWRWKASRGATARRGA